MFSSTGPTYKDYERLYKERNEIADELESCRNAIKDVKLYFKGTSSKSGNYGGKETYLLLSQVKNNRESFWGGADAESFHSKLSEIQNDLQKCQDMMIEALEEIEKALEKKYDDKAAWVKRCYEEMGADDRAIILAKNWTF